jgi:hypothetical protein
MANPRPRIIPNIALRLECGRAMTTGRPKAQTMPMTERPDGANTAAGQEHCLPDWLQERIILVRNSLLSAHYQTRWTEVGVWQVLNRCFLFLQRPTAIVLLDKQCGNGHRRILYHTLADPLWKSDFERWLNTDDPEDEGLGLGAVRFSQLPPAEQAKCTLSAGGPRERYILDHALFLPDTIADPDPDPDPGPRPRPRGVSLFGDAEPRAIFVSIDTSPNEKPKYRPLSLSECGLNEHLFETVFNAAHTKRLQIPKHISKHLQSLGEQWADGKMKPDNIPLTFDDAPPGGISLKTFLDPQNAGHGFFERQHEAIRDIIERQYSKIFESPLLSPTQQNPPNIFFFVKSFTNDFRRFVHVREKQDPKKCIYAHSVRAVLPPSQRDHLAHAFLNFYAQCAELPDSDPTVAASYCMQSVTRDSQDVPYAYAQQNAQGQMHRFLNSIGDDSFFWEELAAAARDTKERPAETLKDIFERMEKPFGQWARSITDPVLESGYLHIKTHPFSSSAQERVHKSLLNNRESNDYRRLVYYHYALSLMTPHDLEISALLIPGYVGGCPWLCIGFLTPTPKGPSSDHPARAEAPEKDRNRWNDNYHFYHSVSRYVVRGIRSKIKDHYLDEIGYWYTEIGAQILSEAFERQGTAEKGPSLHTLLQELPRQVNPAYRALARVFPFVLIVVSFGKGAVHNPSVDHIADTTGTVAEFALNVFNTPSQLIVRIKNNPYFVRKIDRRFVTKEDVQETLQNADAALLFRAQTIRTAREYRARGHIQ